MPRTVLSAMVSLALVSLGAVRRRFTALGRRLGLPVTARTGHGHLTAASLRAGGATATLEYCEDPARVARKDRWLVLRMLEIYVEDLQAATFVADLHIYILSPGSESWPWIRPRTSSLTLP
jgi:hypothetical protein